MTASGPGSRRRLRVSTLAIAIAAALLAAVPPSSADPAGRSPDGRRQFAPAARGEALFDSRAGGSGIVPGGAVLRARRALARSLGPQGLVDVDERTGTPRMVSRLDGFLTGPSAAAPEDVALGYVRSHLLAFGLTARDLGGLELVKDYVDVLGTHHLVWQQRYRGIAAWDDDLRAHVTADGRLVAIGGSPMPGLFVASVSPRLSARDAVVVAYRSVGAAAPAVGSPIRTPAGPERRTVFGSGQDARLVLFGSARGARLAWRTTTPVSSQEIDVSVVDAQTGAVLWRANLVESDQAGTGQAWEYYPSASVPGGGGVQHQVTFPVADGTALFGNNAWTWPDVDDDDSPDRDIPATSSVDWSYPAVLNTTDVTNACSDLFPCSWDPNVPFSWQPHVESSAVQVFHFLNAFHDHLLAAPIGFTEAAGNFQVDNASGQGQDGDMVVANVMDGADTSRTPGLPDDFHQFNANMFTPPDGDPPLMQMYLFPSIPDDGRPATMGGDDASVVYHEYTHGLSNRLVTFADGSGAVNSAQAAAMGEAWSDFYALDYLVAQGLETDSAGPDVVLGRYVAGGRVGFIRFDAIDCPVTSGPPNCPGSPGTGAGGFTYEDFGHVGGGPEVHDDGEIWGQTLWDVRSALGSSVTLTLVTRAMELSPPEPSFLDMRNAILEADQVAFGGSHVDQLWQLFAQRGMGFFAIALDGGDVHPVADFSTPPVCPTDCGTVEGTVIDSQSGRPVHGVNVVIAGHASGFSTDLAAVTNASGAFSIADVPFHEYVVTVESDEHEPFAVPVDVTGPTTVPIELTRDWASIGGGARLVDFTGPNFSPACGPEDLWDAALTSGWGSTTTNRPTGRINIVKLPRAVDITSFGFASDGTCGDGPEAALRVFEIQTKARGGHWVTAYRRSRPLRRGVMHTLRPIRGSTDKVRFVKLVMFDNFGDPLFTDVLELSVRGAPA